VDRAADRDPAHPAFRAPGRELTYGELQRQSVALARLLAEEGVRRGDRVGIFMPRVLESAVAVHGIMRAGAAFVPIDPAVPTTGLRTVIEACGIRHLVTTPDRAAALEALVAAGVTLDAVIGLPGELDGPVRVHAWSALEALAGDGPPPVRLVADDLAYIMFSSGSTGRPKGIMHAHGSGMAYARLSAELYDVVPRDRIGNHSPLHFDMSTFGYLTAPYAGATTVIIPEAYTKLTASLSQLIAAERMTHWYSVPLALIQLLERGVLDERDCSSLRWVMFGGEPFPTRHLRALSERWPQAGFANVYGPAEVNQCTAFHVPARTADAAAADAILDAGDVLPIGHLWDETEGFVIGPDDAAVPAGTAGELVVHSSTMMQGYWNRPDLNARAYLDVPVTSETTRRHYRTGDLVRMDDDGTLHFLGRRDRQVKIRGYRVELDDVELALTSHPAVAEAAVFPVRVTGVERRIEAAVVPTAGLAAPPTADELLGHVAAALSWYAVPTVLEIRADLPRTGTDKIDRRRLQELAEAALAALGESTTASATATETGRTVEGTP
jgi:amino acid adenylation domain-containing protein